MGILDFFFSNHFKVLRVEYYFNSYFNPKSHVVGINDDTSFLLSSVTDFKNPPNTEILRCFRLFPKTCTNIRKNILIELGNDQTKKIDMEKMYNIFFEKNKIDPTVQKHEKYLLHICILEKITKEIILNRLFTLQNQDWMNTERGQQGDAVEWFLQGKLCANDELTNEIGKSFSYTFMKQTCVVKENSLHTLETTGDTPSLVVLDSSEFGPFFWIFLNHYIQINECNCVFDIFERDGNGTVVEWIVHNNDEKEKNKQDIIKLKKKHDSGKYKNLESRYTNELNTAVTNVASYDEASKKIVDYMNKYGITNEDKIRSRDIFNFPHEQEYLFVYAGVRNNFMTNGPKNKNNKRKKRTTNHIGNNNSENNHITQMMNYMKDNKIRLTLEINTNTGQLHFGLFAVIYGGNNQGASHYFSLIRHHDAWYIHNDGQFYQYEGHEIPFHCNCYQASYMVYVKDLESKIQNVGRGYDNTGPPGNLGNSCYLFTIIKVLLLLPGFKTKLRNFINENASRQNKDEFKWIKLYLQLYDLYFPPM